MKTPTVLEFNHILDSISNEDTNGHLFIFDITSIIKTPKQCFLTRPTHLFLKKTKPYVPTKGLPSVIECLKQEYEKGHHKQFQMQIRNLFGPR